MSDGFHPPWDDSDAQHAEMMRSLDDERDAAGFADFLLRLGAIALWAALFVGVLASLAAVILCLIHGTGRS